MNDLITIGFLVILEGLLSFDNALALAALVQHLNRCDQRKALLYGMWGAFAFRFLSLGLVKYFMAYPILKVIGGVYLIYIASKYFLGLEESDDVNGKRLKFWRTVLAVELADMAFSIDSILAGAGVSNKLWVVVTGGILGIIMMRIAAAVFIKLIQRFPRLETSAFLIVGLIGVKLCLESATGYAANAYVIGFFMVCYLAYGFIPVRDKSKV